MYLSHCVAPHVVMPKPNKNGKIGTKTTKPPPTAPQRGSRTAAGAEEDLVLFFFRLIDKVAGDALLGSNLQVAAVAGEDISRPVDQYGQAAA